MPDLRHRFQPKGSHAPTSNAQRQREFRQRNPGYYARLQAQRRADIKARIEARVAQQAEAQAAALQALVAMILKPMPLALPAPAEPLVIPGMNQINAIPLQPEREPVPLQRRTGPFDDLKAIIEARRKAA